MEEQIYIPVDLEDAINEITKIAKENNWYNEASKMSEKSFIGNSHMGIGMWLRNNWKLWHGSPIATWFNNIGITHADDMSGIILTSFHRKANSIDINLDAQVKKYLDFWKKSNQEDNE